MKARLFFVVLFVCGLMPAVAQPVVHVNTRDTVRYGDPWYTFKPMTTLTHVWQENYSLTFLPGGGGWDQVYTSDKHFLYGIFVLMECSQG